jgi:hypothetical protein
MTDEQLASEPNPGAELFGQVQHPEDRREEARRTQDNLTAQGREAHAAEYTKNNAANRRN